MIAERDTPEPRYGLRPGVRLQPDRKTGDPMLLSGESLLVLNATAHEIVQCCLQPATVAEISAKLAAEYETTPEEIAPDIEACLAELLGRNLLIRSE